MFNKDEVCHNLILLQEMATSGRQMYLFANYHSHKNPDTSSTFSFPTKYTTLKATWIVLTGH